MVLRRAQMSAVSPYHFSARVEVGAAIEQHLDYIGLAGSGGVMRMVSPSGRAAFGSAPASSSARAAVALPLMVGELQGRDRPYHWPRARLAPARISSWSQLLIVGGAPPQCRAVCRQPPAALRSSSAAAAIDARVVAVLHRVDERQRRRRLNVDSRAGEQDSM